MVNGMAFFCFTPSFVHLRCITVYPRKSPSNRYATYHQTLAASLENQKLNDNENNLDNNNFIISSY
jgi:hypothetical protein